MTEVISTDFWYLLPVGVLVSTVGMSSGISGSNFWIPIYLFAMGLEPGVVFWTSLLTMLFGFGSGVARNIADGTVSWLLVGRYARIALPATAVAAFAAARLDHRMLLLAFATFAMIQGLLLLEGAWTMRDARHLPGWLAALLGGTFHGAIATGAGVWMLPSLLDEDSAKHHSSAVGSSVVLIFACSLVAVAFRIDPVLLEALEEKRAAVANMVLFAAPGVLIGGQIGPRILRRIPRSLVQPYAGCLLIVIALLVAARVL